ncbi:hypothetical protein D3C79_565990 [compost metagenome]
MASTRTLISGSTRAEQSATRAPQSASANTKNSMEPSWPPHTAASLKPMGRALLACWATYTRVKSF